VLKITAPAKSLADRFAESLQPAVF
jgi:hypothetical protein